MTRKVFIEIVCDNPAVHYANVEDDLTEMEPIFDDGDRVVILCVACIQRETMRNFN